MKGFNMVTDVLKQNFPKQNLHLITRFQWFDSSAKCSFGAEWCFILPWLVYLKIWIILSHETYIIVNDIIVVPSNWYLLNTYQDNRTGLSRKSVSPGLRLWEEQMSGSTSIKSYARGSLCCSKSTSIHLQVSTQKQQGLAQGVVAPSQTKIRIKTNRLTRWHVGLTHW